MSKNNSRTRRDERRARAIDRIDANLLDYEDGEFPPTLASDFRNHSEPEREVIIAAKTERAEATLENTQRNMIGSNIARVEEEERAEDEAQEDD